MSNIKALKSIITSKGQFTYCYREWGSGKKLTCKNGQELDFRVPVQACDRLLFLAYAFLRGIPYRVVEASAGPLAESLGKYDASFLPRSVAYVVLDHGGEVDTGDIEEWLSKPETEARALKRRNAELKSKVERAAKKAAHTAAMRAKYVTPVSEISV